MPRPPTRTARESDRSRRPLHARQIDGETISSRAARTFSDGGLFKRSRNHGRAPSQKPLYEYKPCLNFIWAESPLKKPSRTSVGRFRNGSLGSALKCSITASKALRR